MFVPVENNRGWAKVGLYGFAGSGKTYSAGLIALGLHKTIGSQKPIAFLDAEIGSEYLTDVFQEAGTSLVVFHTRAFKDLKPGIEEARKISDILIIDGATQYWIDIMESYKKATQRARLRVQDYIVVKGTWAQDFADIYALVPLHIILCGRGGWEYEFYQEEDGKMEIMRTHTKMKAEGELSYEPSLLIEMERDKGAEIGAPLVHKAHVLKDRFRVLQGKTFEWRPGKTWQDDLARTWADLAPHFSRLNLTDAKPTELAQGSTELFHLGGKPDWMKERESAMIGAEEVQGLLMKYFPGQTVAEKRARLLIGEKLFGVTSWKAVEALSAATLSSAVDLLRTKLTEELAPRFLSDAAAERAAALAELQTVVKE